MIGVLSLKVVVILQEELDYLTNKSPISSPASGRSTKNTKNMPHIFTNDLLSRP